jgi:catechol 2,3-dioxygenase-like lactoylglutathione lyase family enzyme
MTSIYQRKGLHLPRLHHTSLPIPGGSQEQVRAFYGGLLGLQEKTPPAGIRERGVVWFAAGDNEMELHFVPDDQFLAKAGEARHICLEVDNVEEYRRRIEEAGYKITEDAPIPYRPRFFCRDPFNNYIEFTTIEGDYLSAQ